MKKLSQFSVFDFEAFSKGKLYLCTGQSEWKDSVKCADIKVLRTKSQNA